VEIWTDGRVLDAMASAAGAGDRDARNVLWTIVRPHLEKLAFGLRVAHDDVPDLVQDALLSADTNLHRFDPRKGSFRTWLVTIIIHLRSNLWRRRARRARLLEAMRGTVRRNAAGQECDAPMQLQSALELSRMVPALSGRQRVVLFVYVIGGLSSHETGRLLDITADGVRSIARDARRRLERIAHRIPGGSSDRDT
jgi:RNA polymerase sigma-70 factor (ECF subfamily)